jgi:uncharacterized RDD family membrane protein YckC
MAETEEYLELPYAGFLSRFVAFILDYFLVSIVMGFLLAFFLPAEFMARGQEAFEYNEDYVRDFTEAAGPWLYVAFLLYCIYNAAMHASRWQATLGKRAVGIIVTDLDGERLSFGKAFLRALFKLLALLVFFLVMLTALFTSRRQAPHDMIAGSIVLKYRMP